MVIHYQRKEKKTEEELMRLLEILGNETRIRILKSLSREPMYVSEISNLLRVGQQAILRHLRELEELGIIESYKGESIRGPDRKYYKIRDRFTLKISIQPEDFKIELKRPIERIEDINIDELTSVVERAKKLLLEEDSELNEIMNVLKYLKKNQSKLRFLLKKIDVLVDKLNAKISKSKQTD